MEFIQMIEYKTTKPDEMKALGEAFRAARGDEEEFAGFSGVVVKDRDGADTYVTIVRFPSYEVAMANSQREDTTEMAGKMAALCDGPPTFRNFDVVMDM